jgi:hypothetical protein
MRPPVDHGARFDFDRAIVDADLHPRGQPAGPMGVAAEDVTGVPL